MKKQRSSLPGSSLPLGFPSSEGPAERRFFGERKIATPDMPGKSPVRGERTTGLTMAERAGNTPNQTKKHDLAEMHPPTPTQTSYGGISQGEISPGKMSSAAASHPDPELDPVLHAELEELSRHGESGTGSSPALSTSMSPAEEADAMSGLAHAEAFDPAAVWKMVLSELAMQMPASTFDTWVRDTTVLGYEDGEFIIGLPNAYARDWAENRLRHSIKRTLGSILHRSVQVKFRIRAKDHAAPAEREDLGDAPLYRQPADRAIDNRATDHRATDNRAAGDGSTGPDIPAPARAAGNRDTRNDAPATNDAARHSPSAAPRVRVSAFAGQENDVMAATPEQPQKIASLNPLHTFDTFVVGNHNRLAHAAALAIVDAPGQTFNPLFIYGGVGLGKTHLLHAIGNSMGARGLKLLYCSSEQFTNDLISAIRTQTTEEFRNKYRQIDILLIDDIQFIAGKETTQEEFFHTFNHLHAAGRQVVLSSDRPPKALPLLEERLRSRFEGGLQTDIAQPDFETRVAILQSKANRMGVPVAYDVLMLVAEQVDSNIRELEGALNRLFMQARLADCAVTVGFARTILEDLSPQRSPCTPSELVRIVAEHFGLRADDLTGRKRTKEIAHARQIAMYLLREEHDLSLPAIGGHLGGRDHSTVRYGVSSVSDDLKNDESLRMTVMTLREKIYAPTA